MCKRLAFCTLLILAPIPLVLANENPAWHPTRFGFKAEEIPPTLWCDSVSHEPSRCKDEMFGGCLNEIDPECVNAIDAWRKQPGSIEALNNAEEQCLDEKDPCSDTLRHLSTIVEHRETAITSLSCGTLDDVIKIVQLNPIVEATCKTRGFRQLGLLDDQRCQVAQMQESCNEPKPDPATRCALHSDEITKLERRNRALCSYRHKNQPIARLVSCDVDEDGDTEAQCLSPELIENRLDQGCRVLADAPLNDHEIPAEPITVLALVEKVKLDDADACLFGVALTGSSCSLSPETLRVSGLARAERTDNNDPVEAIAYYKYTDSDSTEQVAEIRFDTATEKGTVTRKDFSELFDNGSHICSPNPEPRGAAQAYELRRMLRMSEAEVSFPIKHPINQSTTNNNESDTIIDCANVPGRGRVCWSQNIWQGKVDGFGKAKSKFYGAQYERLLTWRADIMRSSLNLTPNDWKRILSASSGTPIYPLAKQGTAILAWQVEHLDGPEKFIVLDDHGTKVLTGFDVAWLNLWLETDDGILSSSFDWWLERWPITAADSPNKEDTCWKETLEDVATIACGTFGKDPDPWSPVHESVDDEKILEVVGTEDAVSFFQMLAEKAKYTPVVYFSQENNFKTASILTLKTNSDGVWHNTANREVPITRLNGVLNTPIAQVNIDAQVDALRAGASRIDILPETTVAYASNEKTKKAILRTQLKGCSLLHFDTQKGWVSLNKLLELPDADTWFPGVPSSNRLKEVNDCLSGNENGDLAKCGTKNIRTALANREGKELSEVIPCE